MKPCAPDLCNQCALGCWCDNPMKHEAEQKANFKSLLAFIRGLKNPNFVVM